jgi:hypothetical protein
MKLIPVIDYASARSIINREEWIVEQNTDDPLEYRATSKREFKPADGWHYVGTMRDGSVADWRTV